MKAFVCASSLVVVLAAAIGAGRLSAEGKNDKPKSEAQPRTRIALLNLTYVIKNYDKYNQFQVEIKKMIEPFKSRDQELREELEELGVQAEKMKEPLSPIVPAKAEQIEGTLPPKSASKLPEDVEKRVKVLRREIEDNSAEAKQVLGKRSDREMQVLFQDVAEAARRYARANDIELVLHYNDAVTKADYDSAQNIGRKLNTGSLCPLYSVPGMDISKELVKQLNEEFRNN